MSQYEATGPFGDMMVEIGAYRGTDPQKIAMKAAEIYCTEQYFDQDDLDEFPAMVKVTVGPKKFLVKVGASLPEPEPEFDVVEIEEVS